MNIDWSIFRNINFLFYLSSIWVSSLSGAIFTISLTWMLVEFTLVLQIKKSTAGMKRLSRTSDWGYLHRICGRANYAPAVTCANGYFASISFFLPKCSCSPVRDHPVFNPRINQPSTSTPIVNTVSPIIRSHTNL